MKTWILTYRLGRYESSRKMKVEAETHDKATSVLFRMYCNPSTELLGVREVIDEITT